MAIRFISDLVGTLQTYFKIATVRLKNNSDVLEIKNAGDTAYLPGAMSSLHLPGSAAGLITITAASTSGTVNYILPDADGSSGQVLATDASGNLSWASVATGTTQVKSETESVAYNASSPVTIFTPPASAQTQKVIVNVDTSWDGTTPSMSVGVSGSTSRYMGTTDIDLATTATYEVLPMYQEIVTTAPIIVTFTPGGGGSKGVARVTVLYANPG